MAASTFLKDLIVKWAWTTASATRPTAWKVSLHKADPGVTGASEVAVGDDTAYARVTSTFAFTADGIVKNDITVSFPAAAAVPANYTVTHFGVWDAATAGNFLGGGVLGVPKVVEDGTVLAFGINDLVVEVD